MTDAELRDIYTQALTSRGTGRNACPTPDALEALVTRSGAEEARLATLDHVMSCEACKKEFELLRAIHAAEMADARAAPRRSLTPLLAAAAVVVVVGALTITTIKRPSPVRGAGPSADIELVGIVGPSLVWHAIPGAVHYDVEIIDASGTTLFHQRTTDTTVALPSTISGSWWVRATLRDGSEHRSAIVPLH
jgi:hypothetical protein